MLDLAIRKKLGDFTVDVAFKAETPGVTALFGRSGAGKTSVVRALSGLSRPDSGRIAIGETVFFDSSAGIDLPTERRRIGYVFQDSRLFPHLNVESNLRYGLKRAPEGERAIAVDTIIDLLGIGPLLKRRPHALSGGEKQRVAIGRALLSQPRLLLMDEPLASLDAERKSEVLPYIERLQSELSLAIVYVSHARDEVERLARTLVVVEAGRVTAAGPIGELTGRLDVSGISDRADATSVIDTIVSSHDEARQLTHLGFDGGELLAGRLDVSAGSKVRVLIPAREVILATERPNAISVQNVLLGVVDGVSLGTGINALVQVKIGAIRLLARVTRDTVERLHLSAGTVVFALVKAAAIERSYKVD